MSGTVGTKSIRGDIRVLKHLLLHPVRGETHAERLESFYGGQAREYDSFRARMLHGRRELITQLNLPSDGIWVDMGAGTERTSCWQAAVRIHFVRFIWSIFRLLCWRSRRNG